MTKRNARVIGEWRRWVSTGLAGLALTGSVATAQDDPFGGAPAGAPAGKPAASKPGAAKSDAGDAAGKPGSGDEGANDPAVLVILASKPSQPDEFARAIRNLLDLGYPSLARRYVEGLAGTNPTPEVWADLQARFGTDFFLQLARVKELQPEGAQLSRAALGAGQAIANDPTRIVGLINQLGGDDVIAARKARSALRQVGAPAAPLLVSALAEPARAPQYGAIHSMLVELGPLAVEPALAAFESEDAGLKARLASVLSDMGAKRAISYLVRPALESDSPELQAAAQAALKQMVDAVPGSRDAQRYLRRRVADLLSGSPPVRLDAEDSAELWHWHASSKRPVAHRYSHQDLCVIEAARQARELYILDPDNVENRRWYLATDLEAAKLRVGFDRPLPRDPGSSLSRARALGPAALEDLLVEMTKANRPMAVACACEVLGEIGGTSLVESDNGAPRPLVLAATHSDRRVRFAAVQAILKIDPREPYAGSNYVADSLGFLAASVGSRRALVAHPKLEDAQTLVGLLASLGWEADNATSARSLFVQATRQPDYELILISDQLDRPTSRELLQTLRHEKKTAGLPIGVLVQASLRREGDRISLLAEAEAEEERAEAEGRVDTSTGESKDDAPMFNKYESVTTYHRGKPIVSPDDIRRDSTYFDRTPTPIDPLIKARQWTFGDPRTAVFPRPYDVDGMANVMERLRAATGRAVASRDERIEHARFALEQIKVMADAEPRYGFYELLRLAPAVETALRTADLAESAAGALGALGTPKAQLALVDLASHHTRPLAERQAAVDGFAAAVKRRGLRLTRVDLLKQYDRYNQSEQLDQSTQQVLGAILDIIESRTAQSSDGSTTNAASPAAPSATPQNGSAPE